MKNLLHALSQKDQLKKILVIIPVINFFSVFTLSLTSSYLNNFLLNFIFVIIAIYMIFLGLLSIYLPKSDYFSNNFYCHVHIIFFWFILPNSLIQLIYWFVRLY